MTPLGYALRGLVLRDPQRAPVAYPPVTPPPGLEPPAPVADAENGYLRFRERLLAWPEEGPFPPDLVHRRQALPEDREIAERALLPFRPILDGLDEALALPAWQTPIPEDGGFPELTHVRRLVQALLLRGELDDRSDDRDRAVEIACRLRSCQGPFIHFLVSLAAEKIAGAALPNLAEDRKAAVRWELSRFIVPRAHLGGPWEPPKGKDPLNWADARRGIRWVLAGHPDPYDPAATVDLLVVRRDLMESGESTLLQAQAVAVGAPWPESMLPSGVFGPANASIAELRRIRDAVRDVPNAYGRLSAALTLRAAANLALACEKATA